MYDVLHHTYDFPLKTIVRVAGLYSLLPGTSYFSLSEGTFICL